MTRSSLAMALGLVLVASALTAQPVRVGLRGAVSVGGPERGTTPGWGGLVSILWTRTADVDLGIEAGYLALGRTEIRFPYRFGDPSSVVVERVDRRLLPITLSVRRHYGAHLIRPFVVAGSGVYALFTTLESDRDPILPGETGPRQSRTRGDAWGVNLGGGFLAGRAGAFAMTVQARGHLIIGAGSGLVSLLTLAVGFER